MKNQKYTHAYCYRSGHIEFGNTVPDGALTIRFRATKQEIKKIRGLSRLAYDNKTILVPGIPEAEGDTDAYNSLMIFINHLDFQPHTTQHRRRKAKNSK